MTETARDGRGSATPNCCNCGAGTRRRSTTAGSKSPGRTPARTASTSRRSATSCRRWGRCAATPSPRSSSRATRSTPRRNPDAWSQYRRYIGGVPGPKIVVVQDLDKPRVIGAIWGEVTSSFHRALGCVGTITDGGVRDLDEMNQRGLQGPGPAAVRRPRLRHAGPLGLRGGGVRPQGAARAIDPRRQARLPGRSRGRRGPLVGGRPVHGQQ